MTTSKFFKRLHLIRHPQRIAVFEATFIGLVSGLCAVILKRGVGWLGTWRVHTASEFPAWIVLPAVGLAGGWLAGWLVERFAPEANGSGIPQVKAVLAKVPMALNLRVAVVKLLSGILTLGSGLALGREGPTVQVGASLASQFSRWFPTAPNQRRQLIAAGAGAGLAAAFNAPLAGVFFIVEELLKDFSSATLGTAVLAAFVGAVVSRLFGAHGLDVNLLEDAPITNFSAAEIPLYVLLGLIAGVIGSLFNEGILASLSFNRDRLSLPLSWRVGLAGLFSGLIVAFLPMAFRNGSGLREVLTTGQANWQLAAIALIAQFFLTIIAYGSGAPGGLFAPVLVMGASLGSLMGSAAHLLFHVSAPVTYALAGMGILFSAVIRVPITGIVIVFEMTADFNLVLPLMIGSISAYLTGEVLSPGSLYDRLLEWRGVRLEEDAPSKWVLAGVKASDVMANPVEVIHHDMALAKVVEAFSKSDHQGFPVVDQKKVIGMINQRDISDLAYRFQSTKELSGDSEIGEYIDAPPITADPDISLLKVLSLLDQHQINRLPIVKEQQLVGIITRSDIIRVEVERLAEKGFTS